MPVPPSFHIEMDSRTVNHTQLYFNVSRITTGSRPSFNVTGVRNHSRISPSNRLRFYVMDAATNSALFQVALPMLPTGNPLDADCRGSKAVLFPMNFPAWRRIYLRFDDGGWFVPRVNVLGQSVPFSLAELARRQ